MQSGIQMVSSNWMAAFEKSKKEKKRERDQRIYLILIHRLI